MMSSLSTISRLLLLLSLLWAVISVDAQASFQRLPLPILMSGPHSFAFNSTENGFYTGVSGGTILKYTPEEGFVSFAHITESSDSLLCYGLQEPISSERCGRPAGIAFNEITGDLYVADALLGLHVVSPAGGLAVKIADGVDGNPFTSLYGLDVDPTTGIVYFTSLSSRFSAYQMHLLLNLEDATGKLYKYDPSTKAVTVLMEGLGGSAGCTVSSDGSFVLVSLFTKNKIQRYWIKGPKAGSSEDFSISPSELRPSSIRRIGSTGNFWVAAVHKVINQTAIVKLDPNGEVLQRIRVPLQFSFLSEVNEFNGGLYFGTLTTRIVQIFNL
ncbi:protein STRICTOSIDINE SYNTHASE-LIKE 12 [Raphanus sativus]|uniref:Protein STRICTOSIDINE SYNTHASE-LIKE 12 n=1 Tax=Raphanus sativus TaxID=3726 RepID=A0A6J0KDZ6_RAPSA|nr:protein STRICTOSIDINE SYNTHASE-LIKE 12 [Raphanus sativus]